MEIISEETRDAYSRTVYWKRPYSGAYLIALRQRFSAATWTWELPAIDVQYAPDLSPTEANNLGIRITEAAGLAEYWKAFPPESPVETAEEAAK